VIQLSGLVAVHAQLDPVITETLPLMPVNGTDWLSGETLYVHCASARLGQTTVRTSSAAHILVIINPIHCTSRADGSLA
jgi:hypothetical protein